MILFENMGASIDAYLASFVMDKAEALITILGPIILSGTALYFMVFGYMVIGGYVQNTMSEIVKKAVVTSLIIWLGLTVGTFQSNIIDVQKGLEQGLVSALYGADVANAFTVLDKAVTKGLAMVMDCFDRASDSWGFGSALNWTVVGLIVALGVGLVTVVGAGYMLLAKIAIALLLATAPFFIMGLLWPPTRRFFDAWAGQVITYTLLLAFMAAAMSLVIVLFEKFMAGINLGDSQVSGVAAAFEMLLVGACLVIVTMQIPALVSALGGGVGLSMLNPLQPASSILGTLRSGGRGVYRTVNAPKTRRDMQSGLMETKGRMGHFARGNTVFNPAYNRRNWDNLRNNWGKWSKPVEGKAQKDN